MGRITFAATGDSFMTRRLPSPRPESFQRIAELIGKADVRFTNLETTVHRSEGHPSAFSGGTWAMSPPEILPDLKGYGFNLLAWANNHTMDYSLGGLLATKRYIEQYDWVHAGVGENLAEAAAPKYLETPGGRVALIAATSTFHESWRAGNQRPDLLGRPGVNPLRFKTTYFVSREDLERLKSIAAATEINAERNLSILEGFDTKDPDDSLTFGGHAFREREKPGKVTEPLASDIERLEKAIQEARRQADVVMVSIHSHEMNGEDKNVPADFLVSAARRCIHAGADAVVGHGPHVLRAVEIYEGKPIFYSLGNFIFQNDTVAVLPADFYEKYGIPADANVADALDTRSEGNTKGLGVNRLVWESVVAEWEIQDRKVKKVKLYPISLGFGLPRYERGWPSLCQNEGILRHLQDLSSPFGTEIDIADGIGTIVCD